jgi:tripartite-type tricarboxylate transporter receptor subunit TctC
MVGSVTRRGAALGMMALPFLARGATAQGWSPTRPVRIVIGFPPGGGIDILARLMAPRMSERLGQPVVVENRPGANGLIATQAVAQGEADGHAILFGTTGNMAVNPALYTNAPVDILRDLAPLSHVASLDFVMAVNAALPATTLAEFIALARARPGELNFGSSGNGGLPHLSGELLNAQAGIRTLHIPYRGSAPAYADLIGGRVQFIFDALAIAQPHLSSGRVRALATTGPRRMATLPGVPTAKETLPEFEVVNWYGMAVRTGTPAAAIDRLQQEVAWSLRQPDVAERSAGLGLDLVGSTAEEFGRFQRAEVAKWGAVIRAADIKPE